MGEIIVDGVNLQTYGVTASGVHTFDGPEVEVEPVQIPGRNGDLLLPRRRLQNIPISYDIGITQAFRQNAEALRLYLSRPGYRRIQDTYDPDKFRLGYYRGPLEWRTMPLNRQAEAQLTFICQPQRFLISGETPITATRPVTVTNPGADALPTITILGSGTGILQVGTTRVQIDEIGGRTVLDCGRKTAYSATENRNSQITLLSGSWPVLAPGQTEIRWSGGINRIDIVPRWWTP